MKTFIDLKNTIEKKFLTWVETGVTGELKEYDKRRIRILNIINVALLLFSALFISGQFFFYKGLSLEFAIIDSLTLPIALLSLHLTKRQFFTAAKLVAVVANLTIALVLKLYYNDSGMELTGLLGIIAAIFLFEKKVLIFGVSIFSGISYLVMNSNGGFFKSHSPSLELLHQLATLFFIFLILYSLRLQIVRYHKTLSEQKKLLLLQNDELKDLNALKTRLFSIVPATTSPVWNNYGLFFKTPAATFDVVVRMRNNAPGGAGNDIALDDIAFRPCGPKISAQILGRGTEVDLCETDTTSFLLTSEVAPGYNNPVYQWQVSTDGGLQWQEIPGATTLDYVRRATPAGTYQYRLAVFETEGGRTLACSIASSVVAVTVYATPVVNAGPDRVIIKGETATLEAKATGESLSFVWTPSQFLNNATLLNPIATPDKNITYTLTATSVGGCSNSDTLFIKVIDGIHIPTAFTPNGDGLNDQWRIPDLAAIPGAEVWLFNRNGEAVYHSQGGAVSWDGTIKGKPQASSVFVYLITLTKGQPPLKGLLTLIR